MPMPRDRTGRDLKKDCNEMRTTEYMGLKEQEMNTKLINLAAAVLVALAPVYGQDKEAAKVQRKEARAARKEARAAARQLRRDGYRTVELGAVDTRLEQYFLKTGAGCRQVVGTADGCVSLNLAKLTALSNAANEYAILEGGDVRGRIVSSASSLSGEQTDNLVASFERLVEKEIRGELIPYVTCYRTRGGAYDVRTFCIVDVDAAYRARRHAMEVALEETALAERYGTLVSDWIDEGFWKAAERR